VPPLQQREAVSFAWACWSFAPLRSLALSPCISEFAVGIFQLIARPPRKAARQRLKAFRGIRGARQAFAVDRAKRIPVGRPQGAAFGCQLGINAVEQRASSLWPALALRSGAAKRRAATLSS